MGCVSEYTTLSLSQYLSNTIVFKENSCLEASSNNCSSKFVEYGVEKVFPLYAMENLDKEFSNLEIGFQDNGDGDDPIWDAVRTEAKFEAEKEPILSSFLFASIMSHNSLERALGFVLANRLQNSALLAPQLMDIFGDIMMHDRGF